MSRMDRLYRIDQLLANRQLVTRAELLNELEISWATLKRDIAFLRDRFNAPIIFDHEAGGYRFDKPNIGPAYELPGLWFSADETYALLSMHRLLSDLEPGLLAPHVAPLLARLEGIMGLDGHEFGEIEQRIRLAVIGRRRKKAEHFAVVSRATLERRQLRLRHYSREKNESSERTLSPQRLVYYRNNWYLESWCHTRKALRRFAIDAIESVDLLDAKAREVSAKALDAANSSSYGIYGGACAEIAELSFSPTAARWVADEEWHPEQVGYFEADGRFTLKLPYADPTELVMDILRHGRHVRVVAPESLRARMSGEVAAMMAQCRAQAEGSV